MSAEEPEGKQPYYGDKPPPKEDPKKIDVILDKINSQEGYSEHFFEDFDFAQSQLSEIGIAISRESFEQISRSRSLDSLH